MKKPGLMVAIALGKKKPGEEDEEPSADDAEAEGEHTDEEGDKDMEARDDALSRLKEAFKGGDTEELGEALDAYLDLRDEMKG